MLLEFLISVLLFCHSVVPLFACLSNPDTGNPMLSSPALPPSPLPYLSARVGPLELANALAACVLSARLSSKHRQWAAEQLVQALAATGRDGPSRPQTYSDLAGDLRKCPLKRLEGHYNKVRDFKLYSTSFFLYGFPWVHDFYTVKQQSSSLFSVTHHNFNQALNFSPLA